MKQEDKELLLKDLCARLPYGVKCQYTHIQKGSEYYNCLGELTKIDNTIGNVYKFEVDYCLVGFSDFKPYLRPMLSMTEEEKKELKNNYHFYFDECTDGITNGCYSNVFNYTVYHRINEYDVFNITDWLNSHHFDYRGLIEKGIALEAPKDMYN